MNVHKRNYAIAVRRRLQALVMPRERARQNHDSACTARDATYASSTRGAGPYLCTQQTIKVFMFT